MNHPQDPSLSLGIPVMRLAITPLFLICSTLFAAEHPRLLFPPSAESLVKERISGDSLASGIQKHILARATKVLTSRTCEYRIPDGKRLLSESRLAVNNVLYCGWAWRTTGEAKFRDRVVLELDAACALQDWNPSHFLDTAEMSTAVAIGYDWLYPTLTAEQRTRYEDALIGKGLKALPAKPPGWWNGATNNWTQVCASGLGLAAEAVKEREPELAGKISAQSAMLIDRSVKFYQPDGCYPEGPGYWHYGTNYDVLFRAMRESLGNPLDFPKELRASGDFMRHVVSPTGYNFNYADGGSGLETPTPAQSWIASQSPGSGQAAYVRESLGKALARGINGGATGDNRFLPLHLLWLPGEEADAAPAPLSAAYNGEQAMAFFRTASTPDAAWLAIKGGTGAASHGHMDAGSFVYDAMGVRWFHDLGKDDYNMPGYFGKGRWDYLRMTNLSHNTLVIGGALQALPKSGCPITTKHLAGHIRSAEFDLTAAYAGQAEKVSRLAAFNMASGDVLLIDRITKPSGPVRWAIVTQAAPAINGSRVTLTQNGKTLVLERRDDGGGAWEQYPLKPKTKRENPNQGFHLIGFTAPPTEKLELKVSWKSTGPDR